MASIIIRNLEESLKGKLRVRAAQHGRSMEEEARHILRLSLARESAAPANLFDAMRKRIAAFGGIDLKLPERGPMRAPPNFK
jgi:plasmid stability protein